MAGLMDDDYAVADELARRKRVGPPVPQATLTEPGRYDPIRPWYERAGNFLMDYGAVPAKAAVGMVTQPFHAADSVGKAAADPTLANVTDAGVQTAIAAFRPLTAAKALAAGYSVAAARDAGLTNMGAQADDGLSPAQRQRLEALQKKQAKGVLSRAEREEQNSYLSVQAETAKARSTTQAQTDAERRRLEAEGEAKRKASELAEYERSVAGAERARDTELARANRFSDSEVGKVYAKTGIVTPALAAMGAGGLAKAALGANAGRAPLVAGLGTGAATAHYPLAHDAMLTPAYNPERAGYEAYARELPPSHPRKQEWQDYARGLPEANPSREAASKELYDPVKFGERTGIGLLEGLVSGPAGAHIVDIAKRAPRSVAATSAEAVGNVARGAGALPGLMSEASYLQGTKTQGARGLYERARADADLTGQAAASAPRTSGLPGGLLDDVASQPGSLQPAMSAPRQPPQPVPVQSPSLPPQPVSANVPQIGPPKKGYDVIEGPKGLMELSPAGPWAESWSGAAREALTDLVKSGRSLAARDITAAELRDQIAARLPSGVKPPSLSEIKDRMATMREYLGPKPTAKELGAVFKADKGGRFYSAAPAAIGAGGAAGLGLMSFED